MQQLFYNSTTPASAEQSAVQGMQGARQHTRTMTLCSNRRPVCTCRVLRTGPRCAASGPIQRRRVHHQQADPVNVKRRRAHACAAVLGSLACLPRSTIVHAVTGSRQEGFGPAMKAWLWFAVAVLVSCVHHLISHSAGRALTVKPSLTYPQLSHLHHMLARCNSHCAPMQHYHFGIARAHPFLVALGCRTR